MICNILFFSLNMGNNINTMALYRCVGLSFRTCRESGVTSESIRQHADFPGPERRAPRRKRATRPQEKKRQRPYRANAVDVNSPGPHALLYINSGRAGHSGSGSARSHCRAQIAGALFDVPCAWGGGRFHVTCEPNLRQHIYTEDRLV